MRSYFLYILASKKNGALYTGVTNNLIRRVYEHRKGLLEGFTKKYFIKKLVYWEEYNYIDQALHREKCIKRWKREWKLALINNFNKGWKDLYYDIGGLDEIPVIDVFHEQLNNRSK